MGNSCEACRAQGLNIGSELTRAMLCGSSAQVAKLLSERDLSYQCEGAVNSAVYSGCSRSIVSGDENGGIRVLDVLTGEARQSMSCACPVNVVVCVPELKAIASGDEKGSVIVWDQASGQRRLTITAGALPVKALLYAPHLRAFLAASGGRGVGNVVALNDTTGEKTLKVLCEEHPLSICYVRDHNAVVAGNDNVVTAWAASSGDKLWEGKAGGSPVVGVAHAAALRQVISVDVKGGVAVWEAGAIVRRLRIAGTAGLVLAMAYAPDLQAVVVASSGRTVESYSVSSGALLQRVACGYAAFSMHYAEELQSVILGQQLEGRRLSALVSPSGRTGMVKVLPLLPGGQGEDLVCDAPAWVEQAEGPLL